MLIFLTITLLFWVCFGWFADYSFPYQQVIKLMVCCFTGNLANQVNNLQKKIQTIEFVSQPNNTSQLHKLNNLKSQTELYLGIIERLGSNTRESHERVTKTIEALKQKESEISEELEPRITYKYRILSKIKNGIEFITSTQAQKELLHINKVINNLIVFMKRNQNTGTIIQDSITFLDLEINKYFIHNNFSRLSALYNIKSLLDIFLQKQFIVDNETNSNYWKTVILDELKNQRNLFLSEFNKLIQEKELIKQELQNYSNNTLELQNQNNLLEQKKAQLQESLRERNSEIQNLTNQLNKFSKIKMLEGQYIGNLSNKNSKYHFYDKCSDWKMLVGEYVLRLDDSRNIISSNTSDIFKENGLGKCDFCRREIEKLKYNDFNKS